MRVGDKHSRNARAKTSAVVDDRGPEAIAAMRAIKDALDPHAVMNPGGLLYVGHSENFTESRDLFRLRGKTIYEKV